MNAETTPVIGGIDTHTDFHQLAVIDTVGRQLATKSFRTTPDAAKTKSQVPVWREGLAWSVLSVDYQRILQALTDRARLHQGPLTCHPRRGSATPGRPRVPAAAPW